MQKQSSNVEESSKNPPFNRHWNLPWMLKPDWKSPKNPNRNQTTSKKKKNLPKSKMWDAHQVALLWYIRLHEKKILQWMDEKVQSKTLQEIHQERMKVFVKIEQSYVKKLNRNRPNASLFSPFLLLSIFSSQKNKIKWQPWMNLQNYPKMGFKTYLKIDKIYVEFIKKKWWKTLKICLS